jgi:uncharacterized protein involved in exopolysaccharide biosynthesis
MARSPSVVMTKAELRTAKADLKIEIKNSAAALKEAEKGIKTADAEHAKNIKVLIKNRDALAKANASLQEKLARMSE